MSPVDYPAVTSYHVTTPKGKVLCRIDPTTSPLECRVKRAPGKHRFRVEAITLRTICAVTSLGPFACRRRSP